MTNHFNMNDNKESLGGTEFSHTTLKHYIENQG